MARNYSNIQYETFEQANEAARRRAEKEGVHENNYSVYPHWDKGGKVKTWRISTREVFLYRWERNKCNRPSLSISRFTVKQVRRATPGRTDAWPRGN